MAERFFEALINKWWSYILLLEKIYWKEDKAMSKDPDWLEDRFGDDIPEWAEDRWGDDEDDDKNWNKGS